MNNALTLPIRAIQDVCERYEAKELALFGSAVRDDYSAESDVDLLVEFRPDARVGLIRFSHLQDELEALLHRKVDLVSKRGLNPYLREDVLKAREVIYAT